MPKQVYDQYQSELTQGEEKPWYDFSDLPVWSGTLPGTPEDASHITTELAKDMSPVVGPYRSGVRSTQEYNKMMGLLDEGDYTGAISPAIWSLLESADVGLSALPILGGVLSTPIDLARAIKTGFKTKLDHIGKVENPNLTVGKAEDQGLATKVPKTNSNPVVSLLPHEMPKYLKRIPTLKPEMLKNKKVFPIHADLTDGGVAYTGIDSSQIDMAEPLYGGKKFPSLDTSRSGNVVWAVQGGQDQLIKKSKKNDYAVVVAMNHDAHKSNTSVSMSTLKTVQAYIRDGRINRSNIEKINKLLKKPTAKMEPAVKRDLNNFPGVDSDLNVLKDYFQNVSFKSRQRILDQLSSSDADKFGVPNMSKILRKLEDPETYGSNLGDALLVIELDKGKNSVVRLGKHPGTKEHPSYKYGVKGKVIGKFPAPTRYESVFPEFANPKLAEGRRFDNVIRSSTMSDFNQILSDDVLKNIPFSPLSAISSPRQAELALEVRKGNWISTDKTKLTGGVSPVDFENAIKNSDASSTLTHYTKEEVSKGAKDGSFRVFQLGGAKFSSKGGEGGTSQIFFGIKDTDYNADYGFTHPDLGPNEKAVVGVVSNEPGASGIASPGVMGKAIQEGATALDAFAVPSKKFPSGFLPEVYNDYGFVELGRIPFNEKYYSNQQLNDLKEYWRSTGWDESLGMPDMVIMKWKGDNAIRSNAIRHINENGSIKPRSQIKGLIGAASEHSGKSSGLNPSTTPRTGSVNNPGGNTGGIRDSNVPQSSQRYRDVLSELSLLSQSPEGAVKLHNLGLTPQSLLY